MHANAPEKAKRPSAFQAVYLPLKRLSDMKWAVLLRLAAFVLRLAGSRDRARRLRRNAALLWKGRIGLVGPSRTMKLGNGGVLPRGLISDVRLAEQMNLELDDAALDARYAARFGLVRDLGLFLRGAWNGLIASEKTSAAHSTHFNLFGVIVNNSDTPSIIQTIEDIVKSHPNTVGQMVTQMGEARADSEFAEPAHVCFVNANNFNLALEQKPYREILRRSDLVLPDGIGIKLALRLAGSRLRKNLNGTDLFPHVAEMMARNDWPLFLLGAEPAILERASSKIAREFPALRVVGSQDGFFKPDDEAALAARINASGAYAVVVGMGTPRQELWFGRNAARLHVPLVLTMGGLLDFLGEKNRRAPVWMRQAGLEWLFRLLQEPGRMWKRYVIGNPVFLWRVWGWTKSRRNLSGR